MSRLTLGTEVCETSFTCIAISGVSIRDGVRAELLGCIDGHRAARTYRNRLWMGE
jgi:hypothetical protein